MRQLLDKQQKQMVEDYQWLRQEEKALVRRKPSQGKERTCPDTSAGHLLFLNNFTYFFIFGCAGSSFLQASFSLVIASYSTVVMPDLRGSGFSCCRAQAFGSLGFSSCGS